MNKALSKLTVIAGILFLLVGCNSKETVDDIDTKAIERWQALIQGDYEKAYSYIAPSYRQLEDSVDYHIRMKTATLHTTWNEVKFLSKQCEEETCEVNVEVLFTYKFPKRSMGEVTAPTNIKEHWVKTDGKWYYFPKEKTDL